MVVSRCVPLGVDGFFEDKLAVFDFEYNGWFDGITVLVECDHSRDTGQAFRGGQGIADKFRVIAAGAADGVEHNTGGIIT